MMRAFATLLTFVSVVLFPWPLTALLAIATALVEPLVPLAAGLFADTLYWAPHTSAPLFTLYGAVCAILAFFVRNRVRTGTIG